MVVLEQEDKLTLREKLNYMTSRAVQMPLGITLILFAFQVSQLFSLTANNMSADITKFILLGLTDKFRHYLTASGAT